MGDTRIIGHDVAGNIYTVGTGESPLETNYFKVNMATGVQTRLTTEAEHTMFIFHLIINIFTIHILRIQLLILKY
jgi:hypothetical protein